MNYLQVLLSGGHAVKTLRTKRIHDGNNQYYRELYAVCVIDIILCVTTSLYVLHLARGLGLSPLGPFRYSSAMQLTMVEGYKASDAHNSDGREAPETDTPVAV